MHNNIRIINEIEQKSTNIAEKDTSRFNKNQNKIVEHLEARDTEKSTTKPKSKLSFTSVLQAVSCTRGMKE